MRHLGISRLGLAACIVCVLTATPLLAIAATGQGMPFVGTYSGMVGGQSQDKKASRGVTVFVEQEGAKAKVSFMVSGFPTIVAEGVPAAGTDSVQMPFTVDDMGVKGSGTFIFERGGGKWTLVGSGEGSAIGYDGTGEVGASRVSADVNKPDAADQFMGALRTLGGTLGEETRTIPPADVGPVSPVVPVKTTGPVAAHDAATTYGLEVLVLFLSILLA
jgi:hypothetical protein